MLTVAQRVFKMRPDRLAQVYCECLVRSLDEPAFSRLCARQGGSLLPVAIEEAGFEKVTLAAVPLNKKVLHEFAALDRDMPPLEKGPLIQAFMKFDDLHKKQLSGGQPTSQRNFVCCANISSGR